MHTHTYINTYIYIYMYIYICTCPQNYIAQCINPLPVGINFKTTHKGRPPCIVVASLPVVGAAAKTSAEALKVTWLRLVLDSAALPCKRVELKEGLQAF